jgi:DNA-binding transcriptional ArsR family regulator
MPILFGSEVRSSVLAVLANANGPLTGYRIARTGGLPQPKVHVQLRRLAKAGVIVREREGWVLVDLRLAALFTRHHRVLGWEDWRQEHRRREQAGSGIMDELRRRPHPTPPPGWVPRHPEAYSRPPLKERMVRRMGLKRSYHG